MRENKIYKVEIYRHHIDYDPVVYDNVLSFLQKKDFLIISGLGYKTLVNLYETTEVKIIEKNMSAEEKIKVMK